MDNSTMATIVNSHTVRFERTLPGTMDQAWHYLTDPDGLAVWMLANVDFDTKVGGRVDFKFGDCDPETKHLHNVRGIVAESVPPRLISYSWMETSVDLTSVVRFELKPDGENVQLILTHSYVSPEFMPKVGAGWHSHLDVLIAVMNGEKTGDFMTAYNSLFTKYSAVLATTLVLSSTVSPAIASSNDPAYKALNAQRQQLMGKYDSVWKDADRLKDEIQTIRKLSNPDAGRVEEDLRRRLDAASDDLHRIEMDIRDLDKALI